MMHIVRAAYAKYSMDKNRLFVPRMIYFPVKNEFSEVLEFLNESEAQYSLDVYKCDLSIRTGIEKYICEKSLGSRTVAFLLGLYAYT